MSEEVSDSELVRGIARAASGDPSREVGTGFRSRQVLRRTEVSSLFLITNNAT